MQEIVTLIHEVLVDMETHNITNRMQIATTIAAALIGAGYFPSAFVSITGIEGKEL